MYNRCKRRTTSLSDLKNIAIQGPVNVQDIPQKIKQVLDEYQKFVDEALAGKRGKTAQFWMQYTTIIDLTNVLHRAIKCKDPKLFGYALFKLLPIFFMTNHFHYARSMVLYSLELENLDPEIDKILRSGGFSVNRSGKSFSQVPVDMALEQTINADAKNRLKGIMKYADAAKAVNRWAITNSMKTELVNSLLEMSGMTESSYGHKETQTLRRKKDNEDLKSLKHIIIETIDPFDKNLAKEKHLFNIKTGRKATKDTETYLLNIFTDGVAKRDKFISQCKADSNRFEKPICKTKIVNFATENLLKTNKSRKVAEVVGIKRTRDLFGRLLFLAVTRNISIEKVFEFPLLPEPPCFCHPDGAMCQSDKSTVFDYITQNFTSTSPNSTQTVAADGMFIVKNTINQLCPTFASFARTMLMKVLKLTKHRADLCFDVCESPSIKDTKRKDHGNEETQRNFTFGLRQKFPTDIENLLQISEFKKEFLKFLMKEYEDPVYAHIIGDKIFYCSVDNICKQFYVYDGTLKIEEVYELYRYHLEADTRLVFHAFHADSVNL